MWWEGVGEMCRCGWVRGCVGVGGRVNSLYNRTHM